MKDSFAQCIADVKQFNEVPVFMEMFVSIKARCEKVIGGNTEQELQT